MAKIEYIVNQVPASFVNSTKQINQEDKQKVQNYSVNTLFDSSQDRLEVKVYSLQGQLLQVVPDYRSYSELLNSAGAGKEGASQITIDPAKDAVELGYTNGDVRIAYSFIDDLFSDSKIGATFFIESIAGDRTEFRVLSNNVSNEQISTITPQIVKLLEDKGGLDFIRLNFGTSEAIGVNLALDQVGENPAIVFKTYEPLAGLVKTKADLTIEHLISDTLVFEVEAIVIEEAVTQPFLKGANFDVELQVEEADDTQYFNYDELFSYPVTSSYYELRSLFNEKSAQISIDHTDFSDFIHFSSAEERVRNFKYKLDLIHSYEDQLNALTTSSYSGSFQSGSKTHYENLIEGVVNNFDHYDNFLYFTSGSTSWPKVGQVSSPINHTLQKSTTTESQTFYSNLLSSASNYDVSNFDQLANSIPTFIREDANNDPYLIFIHMLGQHFDNIWIYFKAVSDKYDADNRLDFGISKDLVKSAIESLGVRLYNNPKSSTNLFNAFTGEGIITGSRVVNDTLQIQDYVQRSDLQPISQDNYQREIYKRIYHNIPHLLKTKGTQRGLRALINTFGIPDEILKIKTFGGQDRRKNVYLGPENSFSESYEKIRTDQAGSIITGSTLSLYQSVIEKDNNYSDDSHIVEVGFSISEPVDINHKQQISSSFTSQGKKWSIDDYIGDPRGRYEDKYDELFELTDRYNRTYNAVIQEFLTVLGSEDTFELTTEDNFKILVSLDSNVSGITAIQDAAAMVRLVSFFDNGLFRMIKDFLPARTTAKTGIIVQAPILQRSKAKQVDLSWENKIYSASIDVASITGSHGSSFISHSGHTTVTNYKQTLVGPLGAFSRDVVDESPKYTGIFSGSLVIASDGNLNKSNPFKQITQPEITLDLTVYNLSLAIPPSCEMVLAATYLGEFYTIGNLDNKGTAQVTYPVTSQIATGSSFGYTHEFDTYEFFTIVATPTYPFSFDGWYSTGTPPGGLLLSTASTHTVYYADEVPSGSKYYARFS
jgi:hypothetical protein